MSMGLLLPITTRLVETRAQSVPAGLKYETAWTTAIDASGPVQLAIGASHVFVADAKGGVRALAIADGRETWAKKDAAGARLAAGDGLVFAVANETLHALDEASGAVRWSAVVQGATSAPAWTTGWIVVAAGSDLFALRATDGTDGWRLQLPAALQPPVVFDGSSIVAPLASRTLVAIELSTGKVQHQIPLDVDAGPLLAMGGRLFFSGSDGTVHAFKLAGDEADWRYPLRVPPIGAPAANDKCVFVTLFDNSLHALDVEIGNKCWSRSLPSRPAAGPKVAGDYVVVPLTSGGFAIINAKDGKLVANLAAAETLEAFAVSADASQVATVTIGTESRKVTLQRRVAPVAK